MTLDGLTLHCIVNELKNKILSAKVQKVQMPAREEIVLQLYSAGEGNLRLAISADAGDCALYLTGTNKPNPKVAPSFCMFLRKHLTGAIISSVEQSGLNRVVTICFDGKDELMRPVSLKLIVEIMGKYSNIILTDGAGKVLDSIRRVSPDLSSMRTVLPGVTYADPPQKKFSPTGFTAPTLAGMLRAEEDTRITQHITSVFDGLSTQAAAEILHRADIGTEYTSGLTDASALKLAEAMRAFLAEAAERPRPCLQLNSDSLPVFFSCIPYETYPEVSREYFESCNAMLEHFYTRRAEIFRLTQQRDALAKSISKILSKLEKRINIYQSSLEDIKKADKFQRRADHITANLYRLKKGMSDFETIDYETGESLTVQLDLSMTPQELAQKLYKKIAKYKKTAEYNGKKLAEAFEEQEFLLGALHFTENATQSSDIADIRQSLQKAGYLASPPKSKKQEETESLPLSFTSPTGYEIFVGKNDRQNDTLTMRTAAKDDIWFHAQKIPGSHVLLVTKGKELDDIDDETIVFAARLAASHSRAKQSGKTAVDYTQRKNIKKPPNARPGKVIYDDYFTVYVDAND